MKAATNRPLKTLSGGDDMADALLVVEQLLPMSNGARGRRGLFSQLGSLVRCEEVGGGDYGDERLHGPAPATLTEVKAAVEADWRFERAARGNQMVNCSLTPAIVNTIMSLGEWPQMAVPELKGASEWVTTRADGTLITESGYDPATGVYVRMDDAVKRGVSLVLPDPAPSDIERAKYLLQEDLLGDFEWESPADAANALAAVITGSVRYAYTSTVPLFLLDATMAMSGKGTLAEVIQKMAGVTEADVRSFPKDDDELGKSIVSTLRSSSNAVIVWDNVEQVLEGETLAALLTARVFKKRLLRGNDDFVGLNDRIWCATGNNMRLGKDIRRRSVRCRQKPTHDPREGKRKFRHDDTGGLFVWMDKKRDALAWAVGTLVRAWAAAGRPGFSDKVVLEKMASFKSWINVVGGILEVAGVDGFLANVAELQYDDEATMERADMLEALEKLFGGGRFTAAEAARSFNDASPEVQEALPAWMRGKGMFVNVTTNMMRAWLSSNRDQMAGLDGERRVTEAGLVNKKPGWMIVCSIDAPVADSDSSTLSAAAAAYLGNSV